MRDRFLAVAVGAVLALSLGSTWLLLRPHHSPARVPPPPASTTTSSSTHTTVAGVICYPADLPTFGTDTEHGAQLPAGECVDG